MNTIMVIIIVAELFLVYMLIRNGIVLGNRLKAIDMISAYCYNLIKSGRYDYKINYYDLMMEDYGKSLWRLWDFSVIGVIKKEYRKDIEG